MFASDFPKVPARPYASEKLWHGMSCCCGGGYRVGHPFGCEWATRESNLRQLCSDLAHARVNGDAEETADLEPIKAELEEFSTCSRRIRA